MDILKNGTFQAIWDNLSPEKKREILKRKNYTLGCIDEGITGELASIHLPGSGINMEKEELKKFLKENNIDSILTHEGCAAEKVFGDGSDRWVKSLANGYDLIYISRLPIQFLNRPADKHDARIIYYDTTNTFNYDEGSGFSKGMTLSCKYLESDYVLNNLELALEVLFGKHGLEKELTETKPLILVKIVNKESKLIIPEKEIMYLLSLYKNRVKIETLNIGQ